MKTWRDVKVTGDSESKLAWYVYMIQASDQKIYTGITTDILRRWQEHASMSQGGQLGAKFFRARQPSHLVFLRQGFDRSSATRYEVAVKRLSRQRKLALIASDANQLTALEWQPQ